MYFKSAETNKRKPLMLQSIYDYSITVMEILQFSLVRNAIEYWVLVFKNTTTSPLSLLPSPIAMH